jgi:glycine cleavage system aminomethyltransferase T
MKITLANQGELDKAKCFGIVGTPLKDEKGEVIGQITSARLEDGTGRIIYEADLNEQGMKHMKRDLAKQLWGIVEGLPE